MRFRALVFSTLMAGCATGEAETDVAFDGGTMPVVDSGAGETLVDAPIDTAPPPDVGPVVTTGLKAHNGHELVSAGAVTKSANYRMVSNLGAMSPQTMVMKSEKYRTLGGIVGATAGK